MCTTPLKINTFNTLQSSSEKFCAQRRIWVLKLQSENIKHVMSGYCFVFNFLTFPMANNKEISFIITATKNWYKQDTHIKSGSCQQQRMTPFHFPHIHFTVLLPCDYQCLHCTLVSFFLKKKRNSTKFILSPKHWTWPINYCSLVTEVILWTASTWTKQL